MTNFETESGVDRKLGAVLVADGIGTLPIFTIGTGSIIAAGLPLRFVFAERSEA